MSAPSDNYSVGRSLLSGYLRENPSEGESCSYHPPVPGEDIRNLDAFDQNIGGKPVIYFSKSPFLISTLFTGSDSFIREPNK